MDELKTTISKNLVELRTQAGLTQLQLAEKLNYSDKAVSKWERGEAIPDIRVLIQLSELYGISLDDLVKGTEVSAELKPEPEQKRSLKHFLITALSVVLVWFIATGIFATLYFIPSITKYAWLVFVVAPLPTGVVLTVFSSLWGDRFTTTLSCSVIVWSIAVLIHVYVEYFVPGYRLIYMIYVVVAVFELLIILWFIYRGHIAKRK